MITDEDLLEELPKVPKGKFTLEADVRPMGAPREIRVSNVIVAAALEEIWEIFKIKLRRVKQLKGIDELWMTMGLYR